MDRNSSVMALDLQIPTKDDIPELTRSIRASFKDCSVPITMDEAKFRLFMKQNDIVMDQSVVAIDASGAMVGQSLSGIRGERAWVAATGLAEEHRGKGSGVAMLKRQLDLLRARGTREAALEVLDQNLKAQKVYQALGFKRRRDLYSFQHSNPKLGQHETPYHLRFEDCKVLELEEFYRPDDPWQSSWESVKGMEGCKAFLSFLTVEGGPTRAEGVGHSNTDPDSDLFEDPTLPHLPDLEEMDEILTPTGPELEGYCVFKATENGTHVIDLYSVANARELLRHLMIISRGRPVFTTNIFDAPSVMAYESFGFERYMTQHEMRSLL